MVRYGKLSLAAISLYLVTETNVLAVYATPLEGVFVQFSSTTETEIEILIFDFSNASATFNSHSMKRFWVRKI